MSIIFTSFKHFKLLRNIKIANCLYLHDSYISKFEFLNSLFANLLVAWLYEGHPIKNETFFIVWKPVCAFS